MKYSKKYLIWTIIVTVLAVLINGYIIMHSCLDAMKSTEASTGVVQVAEDVVNTVSPGTVTPENHDSFASFIRKAFGHFGLFVISGLLSSLAFYLWLKPLSWSKHYWIASIGLAFGLSMGILTELIQLNVPGRSGEFTDVLIDFSGYLLGALIISFILFIIFINKNKKSKASQ